MTANCNTDSTSLLPVLIKCSLKRLMLAGGVGAAGADFFHIWWNCKKVVLYWKMIPFELPETTGFTLSFKSRLLLLNVLEDDVFEKISLTYKNLISLGIPLRNKSFQIIRNVMLIDKLSPINTLVL